MNEICKDLLNFDEQVYFDTPDKSNARQEEVEDKIGFIRGTKREVSKFHVLALSVRSTRCPWANW